MIDTTDAKTCLEDFRQKKMKLELLSQEIERLDSLATKVNVSYSDKIQTSCGGGDDILCKLVDKKEQLEQMIKEYLDDYVIIDNLLSEIKEVRYEYVLRLRYLDCMRWEDISVKLKYTLRWVHRLHGKALIRFNKVLSKHK